MAVKASAAVTLSTIRDIRSVTWYYLLQPSAAAVPSKPTTLEPPVITTEGFSGWYDTEPSYSEGDTRSLYVTERTVYTDDTFDYTHPSLSSSYEAAKLAYNEALAAQTAAGSALLLTQEKTSVYYGTEMPTTQNTPFTSWDEDERDSHLGDLYYDTVTGYLYRLIRSDETYAWDRIKDSDIEEAFEVADGNRNYISQHFRMDDSGFTVAESLNGSETGVRVVLKGDRLSFYHGASEVAYISDQRLYISQSVVLQQMDVGVKQTETDVKGDPGKGQWSWKVHENAEGKNNLYLKWLG